MDKYEQLLRDFEMEAADAHDCAAKTTCSHARRSFEGKAKGLEWAATELHRAIFGEVASSEYKDEWGRIRALARKLQSEDPEMLYDEALSAARNQIRKK